MNTPWKRLEAVIIAHGFKSVNAFAKHIGLRRSENLYQIKRGKNNISPRLASTIARHFPEVSRGWLLTGEGQMLLTSPHTSPAHHQTVFYIDPFFVSSRENISDYGI